jgi:hypothetical protein
LIWAFLVASNPVLLKRVILPISTSMIGGCDVLGHGYGECGVQGQG